jgi:hypothetical protein
MLYRPGKTVTTRDYKDSPKQSAFYDFRLAKEINSDLSFGIGESWNSFKQHERFTGPRTFVVPYVPEERKDMNPIMIFSVGGSFTRLLAE